jgi:hypothetical protein
MAKSDHFGLLLPGVSESDGGYTNSEAATIREGISFVWSSAFTRRSSRAA